MNQAPFKGRKVTMIADTKASQSLVKPDISPVTEESEAFHHMAWPRTI